MIAFVHIRRAASSKQIRRSIYLRNLYSMIQDLLYYVESFISGCGSQYSSTVHNASHGPLQSLVGAGSRLAARSWVSPELAAQPAATHSRFSLRFLLRACCPGKNQGSLHNPLHVFKRRSWVWTKKTCWKMQEFAQNHSMPWVPGPRCLNWAQRERGSHWTWQILCCLQHSILVWYSVWRYYLIYYLYLTCALGARSFLLTDLSQKLIPPLWSTLPETNIAPANRPSQKETSIPIIHFQVLC